MSSARETIAAAAVDSRIDTDNGCGGLCLHDGTLAADLDIAFSTHLTLVVPARIEFVCGTLPQDLNLVISRAQCRNSRPRLQALLDAAQLALARNVVVGGALRSPLALLARVAGQWHALWRWPVAGAGPVLPAT